MEIKCLNRDGKPSDSVEVSAAIFDRKYNEALVHQLVVSHLSNARKGNRAQKSRGQVRASGRKPWRQKGTGRARVGTVASPIWRGGGKVFPSSPDENFRKKVNRKMFRAGIATIVSQLHRESRLTCIDGLVLEHPKTKVMSGLVKELGFDSLLMIVEKHDENLHLASRNLVNVRVLPFSKIDPVSLIKFENTMFTRDAMTKFQEAYS